MTPCSDVEYQRFRGPCCLQLLYVVYSEDHDLSLHRCENLKCRIIEKYLFVVQDCHYLLTGLIQSKEKIPKVSHRFFI